MDVAGLLSALAASARGEAEALVRDARTKAEAIAAEGGRRRTLLRARAKGEADAAFAAALDGEVRSGRREAQMQALQERQRFLEDVRRRAAELLPGAVDSPEYRARLGARLAEALEYADGEATVRCAPALLAPLTELADGRARLEATAAISDGFEIVARGGALRIDARLSTELDRLWPLFAVELAGKAAR